MRRHTIIYFDFFGYDISDFIPCEICGKKAVDIHHIENKKSGGNPSGTKDIIENLMALCREDHLKFGDYKEYKQYLKNIHLKKIHNFNNNLF